MRKLAILTFVTLDGVMQAPSHADEDRSGGFEHGGWARPFWDEVMVQTQTEAMAEPYDFLYGRKTFDLFSAHWQKEAADDPAADTINQAQKYVVTSRSDDLGWSHTHRISGDVPAEIAKLKAMDGPLLQVHGSGALIQTLLAHDLVDELRLWTFPVVIGSGKRLFDHGSPSANFGLIKTASTPGGVIMGLYDRQR